jgi:hypothetical protein
MDDDDLFLDHRWATPVPGVPVSAGPVVSFDPDTASTTWRRADDFPLVDHAARQRNKGD